MRTPSRARIEIIEIDREAPSRAYRDYRGRLARGRDAADASTALTPAHGPRATATRSNKQIRFGSWVHDPNVPELPDRIHRVFFMVLKNNFAIAHVHFPDLS